MRMLVILLGLALAACGQVARHDAPYPVPQAPPPMPPAASPGF
jgi:hypothetical protein